MYAFFSVFRFFRISKGNLVLIFKPIIVNFLLFSIKIIWNFYRYLNFSWIFYQFLYMIFSVLRRYFDIRVRYPRQFKIFFWLDVLIYFFMRFVVFISQSAAIFYSSKRNSFFGRGKIFILKKNHCNSKSLGFLIVPSVVHPGYTLPKAVKSSNPVLLERV